MAEFAVQETVTPVTPVRQPRAPAQSQNGGVQVLVPPAMENAQRLDVLGRILQRSCQERALRRPHAVPTTSLIQRAVAPSKAEKALQTILVEHGLRDWYNANWGAGKAVKRIAKSVADQPDTDKDNLAKKLRAHPEIMPLLRQPRTEKFELHPNAPDAFDDPDVQKVYAAYLRLLFYHATVVPEKVRLTGLDPSKGGTEGGYAATRSLQGQSSTNVSGAKGRAYVTRDYSEAKQYAKDTGTIVRILIPKEQRARLQVDPDSRIGVYCEEPLLGVDLPDRRLSWRGQIYLRQEIEDWGTLTAKRIDEIYEKLVTERAFLPGAPALIANTN